MTQYKSLLIQARDALQQLPDCSSPDAYGEFYETALSALQAAIDQPQHPEWNDS